MNEAFPQTWESSPRTREDIIGGFSGDESDKGEEEHEHSDTESDESINRADLNPKVKFLPATESYLKNLFENELVFLPELLRQEGIDRDQYKPTEHDANRISR